MPPLQTVYFFVILEQRQMKPPSKQHEGLRLISLAQINPKSSHSMMPSMAELSLLSLPVVNQNIGPVSAPCPQVLNTHHLIM